MDQALFHQQLDTSTPEDTYEKIRRVFNFDSRNGLKILDVGCGNGKVDGYLRGMGHSVTGMDINDSLKYSAQNIKVDINVVWPVGDKIFDVIICTDVIEHLYDPVHVLKESLRVLKDGGQLILGIPNHFDVRQRLNTLWGKGVVHWDCQQYGERAWSTAHIRFLTLDDLNELLFQNGLAVVKSQFNFMGSGIFPSWLPSVGKLWLLKRWPNLFSGKFVVAAVKRTAGMAKYSQRYVYISDTLKGL